MKQEDIPLCQGPDANPAPANFVVPRGTIDCHAHIFGAQSEYALSPKRGYTPPVASLDSYLALHRSLGGIERAVLTQPSVYGTDNSCMLDVVDRMDGKFMAVAALGDDVTDKELEVLHNRRVRGVRVNLVDKGGMPFDDIKAVRRFTERIKNFGWHLEILVHVHEFADLRATINSMAVDVSVGHLGYMRSDNGIENPGFQELLGAVRDGHCWVKLSGPYRVTRSPSTPYEDVAPIARALVEANEDRVVWGTDWPHPVFTGNMPNDGALMDHLVDWIPDEATRHKVLVDNAEALYGFRSANDSN